MPAIIYPDNNDDRFSVQHRCGGYYETKEDAEIAASRLEFPFVAIPPPSAIGWYIVPVSQKSGGRG